MVRSFILILPGYQKNSTMLGTVFPHKTKTLLSTTVSPQSHSLASYFKSYLVLQKDTHREISIQQLWKTFDWSWRIIVRRLCCFPWITQITINKRIQSFSIQKRMWINSFVDQRGISCEPPLKRLQNFLGKAGWSVKLILFSKYGTKDVSGYKPDTVLLGSVESNKL